MRIGHFCNHSSLLIPFFHALKWPYRSKKPSIWSYLLLMRYSYMLLHIEIKDSEKTCWWFGVKVKFKSTILFKAVNGLVLRFRYHYNSFRLTCTPDKLTTFLVEESGAYLEINTACVGCITANKFKRVYRWHRKLNSMELSLLATWSVFEIHKLVLTLCASPNLKKVVVLAATARPLSRNLCLKECL